MSYPSTLSPMDRSCAFTQQQLDSAYSPRPTTPAMPATPRSPFVPVRKHRSVTPPTHTPVSSPGRGASCSYGGPSQAAEGALRATTRDNQVAPQPHLSSSPQKGIKSALSPGLTRTGASLSLASHLPSTSAGPGAPLGSSSAPKIRARLTPAAAPRRKCLPGTEGADVPVRIVASGSSSPERLGVVSAATIQGGLMGPPPLPRSKQPAFAGQALNNYASHSASPAMLSPIGLGFGGFPQAGGGGVGSLAMGLGAISLDAEMQTHGRSAAGKDNVLVCVRVRPPAAKLAAADLAPEMTAWETDSSRGTLSLVGGTGVGGGGPNGEYQFDSVVTGSDNEGVYDEAGRGLVQAAMEGFDAVIFAYGQTASGKTFTLTGNAANPGIIPQAVQDIFQYIKDHPDQEFLLRASYLEIYNETLKDLLAPEAGPLRIRQDEKKRFFVHPLREEVVTGEAQVAALLRRGEENRSTGRTDFNERSSRSHSVFQMTIESRDDTGSPSSRSTPSTPFQSKTPNGPRLAPGASGAVRMSRLSLIDLAGSEQAVSQADRRAEGAFINKSLLTLEKVIASLTADKKGQHVPYRDSKLTQILQPSLSGAARVAVVATVNPSPAAVGESQSTLKFAQRVKKVALKAVVNEVVDDKALIFKYRNHIAALENQLRGVMHQAAQPLTPSKSTLENTLEAERQKDQRVKDLQRQLSELQSLFVNSGNLEKRRQSALPPRPVSPMKMRRSAGGDSDDEGSKSAEKDEKLLELEDEVAQLNEERRELLLRVAELEREVTLSNEDVDARVNALKRENQELMVVAQNADGEAELKRMERRYERKLDKCAQYEKSLEASLQAERKRVHQFERFILQHLATQADALATGRRSSLARPGQMGMPASASVMGFLPIMQESPDLEAVHPDFLDAGDEWGFIETLPFSDEGRAQARMSIRGR